MLSLMQTTGHSVSGQLYECPRDSPQPELEQWRETMAPEDAQNIDVPGTAITSFGRPWQEVVSRQRERNRLGPSPVGPPPGAPRGAGQGRGPG
eukprot:47023-Alexandrium_andersonii.AAC.1